MQTWLAIFIGRLLSGERLEKATPYDYRLWFGILFLTPVLLVAFTKLGRPALDASTFWLWLGVTCFGLVAVASGLLVARFVPARVSLALSVISWISLFVWFYPFAS